MNHYIGIIFSIFMVFIFCVPQTVFFLYVPYYVITRRKKISKLYGIKKFNPLKFMLYFLFPPSSWYVVSKIILFKRYNFLKKTSLFFVVITIYLFFGAFTILDLFTVLLCSKLKTANSEFHLLILTIIILWGIPLSLLFSYVYGKFENRKCCKR